MESWYWSEDLGYAKSGATWGICLRKLSGDYQRADEDEQIESWLFNDAPRTLRISAIDKIPELLEKLSEEAVKTTNEIRKRLSDAQAVAEAVKGSPNLTRVPLTFSTDPLGVVRSNPAVSSWRSAIGSALIAAGHSSAAQLLAASKWSIDGASLRIEVPGVGKKMLALTVNAAAEKVVRQELEQLGAPVRFTIVPGFTTEEK
jgi:hypothetical protein